MKNKTLFFIASILSSSIALAEPVAKLEGVLDFGVITRNQKKIANKNLSAHNKSVVFNTSVNVTAKVENQLDDLKYGAKIVMLTTTAPKKTPSFNGSYVFVENEDFGRLEVGAPFAVSTNMCLDGNAASVRPKGGSWQSILNTNPNDANGFNINVLDLYLSGFTSKNFGAVDREPSRKVNYYTPKMKGFQLGITFIPDSTNGGSDDRKESTSYSDREIWYLDDTNKVKKYKIRYGAKNVFAFGLTYEAQLAEATSIKLGAVGEVGKAIQEAYIPAAKKSDENFAIDPSVGSGDGNEKTLTGANKIQDLRGYNLGARLDHGNFAYSVSYGNLCKSFTSKAQDEQNRSTEFYGAAVSYTQGKIGVSLTYLGGSNRKNIFNSVAVSSEYNIAPGLVSYAEVGYASGRGKGKVAKGDANAQELVLEKQKFNGVSFMLGLAVKF